MISNNPTYAEFMVELEQANTTIDEIRADLERRDIRIENLTADLRELREELAYERKYGSR